METPASLDQKSQRPYAADLPDPEYPAHFEVRRVTRIGVFWWHSKQIFLTNALRNEAVGLETLRTGSGQCSMEMYCSANSTKSSRRSKSGQNAVTFVIGAGPGLKKVLPMCPV